LRTFAHGMREIVADVSGGRMRAITELRLR
jgi:hypothetical protein